MAASCALGERALPQTAFDIDPADLRWPTARPPRTLLSVTGSTGELPVDRFPSEIAALLAHWERLAAGGIPRWRSFDPVDGTLLLRHLVLWDVLPDGGGYRCRLAGTEVCDAAGRELRGLSPEAVGWDAAAEVRRDFDAVRDGRGLSYVERDLGWPGRDLRGFRRLVTPWAGDDGRISHLLAILVFLR